VRLCGRLRGLAVCGSGAARRSACQGRPQSEAVAVALASRACPQLEGPCCVLRVACCVLRVACCVLRVASRQFSLPAGTTMAVRPRLPSVPHARPIRAPPTHPQPQPHPPPPPLRLPSSTRALPHCRTAALPHCRTAALPHCPAAPSRTTRAAWPGHSSSPKR
jgi:hypothetical protein